MSFRERFHISSTPSSVSNLNFSAKDPLRNLTLDGFNGIVFKAEEQEVEEADTEKNEKDFGFAYLRTRRGGITEFRTLLLANFDLAEDAVSCLCGCSALSDSDLIKLTELDPIIFKRLLGHDSNVVRCSAIFVCSKICIRIWTWFSLSATFDSREDFDTSQQDVRNWVVLIWRAIADRFIDNDDSVSIAAFDALDDMSSRYHVLFERVARHLLPMVTKVVDRATLIRTTSSTRFSTKLLSFSLGENRPHSLISSPQLAFSLQSFLRLNLIPIADGTVVANGDVSLTAAECGLDLIDSYNVYSTYEAAQIKAYCVNASLAQLRALESNALSLPDSARTHRRQRCAKILFRASENSKHLPPKQRIRILGRCAVVCSSDANLKSILRNCCRCIVNHHSEDNQEDALQALLLSERGILRSIWKTPGEARHRLADALLNETLQSYKKTRRWLEFSARILEGSIDCLTWDDSSFKNHAAGNAYVDLLTRRVFCDDDNIDPRGQVDDYIAGDEDNQMEKETDFDYAGVNTSNTPSFERFLRQTIEWKIESISNFQVKARLLWVCERAFCMFSNPDVSLGNTLIDTARVLATADLKPQEDFEDLHLNSDPSLFLLSLAVLSHLARSVPNLKNSISACYGQLSLKAKELNVIEKRCLEERTKEIERPRSFALQNRLSYTLNPRKQPFSIPKNGDMYFTLNQKTTNKLDGKVTLLRMASFPTQEFQLSGGSDPLYILGQVELKPGGKSLHCLVKIFNSSNLAINHVSIRYFIKGANVKLENKQSPVVDFPNGLKPGAFLQLKFSLDCVYDKSVFQTRNGVDIRININMNELSYTLPTWWFPNGLWLNPTDMDFQTFRFHWGKQIGSSSKCEIKFISDSQAFSEIFEQSCLNFHLVVRSNAFACYSATSLFRNERVLLTCQVCENSLALDLRSNERNLFNTFDFRQLEDWFPSLQSKRIIWSGASFWGGSRNSNEKFSEEDEFICPESLWSITSFETNTPMTNRQNLSFSLEKWKSLTGKHGFSGN